MGTRLPRNRPIAKFPSGNALGADLAARAEVAILRVSPIVLAELEIRLEDAMELASPS